MQSPSPQLPSRAVSSGSVSTSDDEGVLARLRSATRDAHARLETRLGFLERAPARDSYAALLARLYGFHRPHERRLERCFSGRDFWPPRRRTGALAADLERLGIGRSARAALPEAPLVAVDTKGAAFGCLYVFEGATLGGRTIERHVSRCPELVPALGYFGGRGRRTGPMWRETCALLEREVRGSARDEAVASACATFAALDAWLAPAMSTEGGSA